MLAGPGFGLLLIPAQMLPLALVPSRLIGPQGGDRCCMHNLLL